MLLDYLMDSLTFLKNQDLQGWKAKFLQTRPAPPPKRIKMSPGTFTETPLPPCMECESTNVIEDIKEGIMVCVSCGLIQSRVVSMDARAHCTYEDIQNRPRVYIHRYSRISYFWTVIRLLQGDTSPIISADMLSRLQAEIVGTISVVTINDALRKLNVSKKYRRHRWSLLRMLTGIQEYKWSPEHIKIMLKSFRRIEYYWKYYKKSIPQAKKAFFSYTSLIYIFLLELGEKPCNSLLLKTRNLREREFIMYNQLQNLINKNGI
jgi:hypothetical protein